MYNNADIISETHEHIAMGKLQIRRIKWPHFGLTTILQEILSVTYNLARDSMGLCWLVFMQLSLKVEPSESKAAATKAEFYIK